MIITYYGIACFKIESQNSVIAIDPPSKKGGAKTPRFQTDIILSSHDHNDHNGVNELQPRGEEKTQFVINSPGEYEINNIKIHGIASFHDSNGGKKYGLNTIYVLTTEELRVCHLGDFGENELRDETKEKIGTVDILFLPVGDKNFLDAKTAASLARNIDPRIIIPMHYGSSATHSKELKKFLEEMTDENIKPLDKFTIKKREIPQEKSQIIVLNPAIK